MGLLQFYQVLILLAVMASGLSLANPVWIPPLISFSPDIYNMEKKNCQGIWLTKNWLATSPSCSQKIQEHAEYAMVGIHDVLGRPVGVIAEPDYAYQSASGSALLPIDRDEDSILPAVFPVIYQGQKTVPEQTVAYFIDKEKIIQAPVTLSLPETDEQGYLLNPSSIKTLPAGTPVFDSQSKLVCMVAEAGQCVTVNRAISGDTEYKSDYDYDSDSGSDVTTIALAVGFSVTAYVLPPIVSVIIFYSLTYYKARSKGISSGYFWEGVCCCGYCGHCKPMDVFISMLAFSIPLPCSSCVMILGPYRAVVRWLNEINLQELTSIAKGDYSPVIP